MVVTIGAGLKNFGLGLLLGLIGRVFIRFLMTCFNGFVLAIWDEGERVR